VQNRLLATALARSTHASAGVDVADFALVGQRIFVGRSRAGWRKLERR